MKNSSQLYGWTLKIINIKLYLFVHCYWKFEGFNDKSTTTCVFFVSSINMIFRKSYRTFELLRKYVFNVIMCYIK